MSPLSLSPLSLFLFIYCDTFPLMDILLLLFSCIYLPPFSFFLFTSLPFSSLRFTPSLFFPLRHWSIFSYFGESTWLLRSLCFLSPLLSFPFFSTPLLSLSFVSLPLSLFTFVIAPYSPSSLIHLVYYGYFFPCILIISFLSLPFSSLPFLSPPFVSLPLFSTCHCTIFSPTCLLLCFLLPFAFSLHPFFLLIRLVTFIRSPFLYILFRSQRRHLVHYRVFFGRSS